MDMKTYGNMSVNADNVTHVTLKQRAQPAGEMIDDNALRLHFVGGTSVDLFGADAETARAEFAGKAASVALVTKTPTAPTPVPTPAPTPAAPAAPVAK